MDKNWIITEQGDPINLNYVSKVMWGGDFAAGKEKPLNLYIFHAGVAYTAGTSGASTVYGYATARLAKAARDRIRALLLEFGSSDLRTPAVTLTSITPATSAAGASTLITLVGTGLSDGATITINGIDMTATVTDGEIQFTTDAGLTAGTYDVDYTDANGGVATLTNGIIIT